MKKALIVGINFYERIPHLNACVNDAVSVGSALERHADGTVNFATPLLLLASDYDSRVTKRELKDAVRDLFATKSEIALLYFSGHGHIEDVGAYLCASDSETGDDGFALSELMGLANKSPATNRLVVLDSCYSGAIADRLDVREMAEITTGTTLLSASTASEAAYEATGGGSSIFTKLLIDALNGAAANLLGDVTPGSIYAHIDQSLGPWGQRPMFKTNVQTFTSLRKASPPIDARHLRSLATYFPEPGFELRLDPSFEPERFDADLAGKDLPAPNAANTIIFAALQELAKVGLVRPVGADHMWHAAMQSRSCKLTVVGEHYRNLVASHLI